MITAGGCWSSRTSNTGREGLGVVSVGGRQGYVTVNVKDVEMYGGL